MKLKSISQILNGPVFFLFAVSNVFAVYEDHYYEDYTGGEYTEISTSYDGSVGGDPDYFGSISGGYFNGGITRPGYAVNISNLNSAKIYTGLLPDGSINSYGTQIMADSYDGVYISMNNVNTLEYANAGILSSNQKNAINIIDSTSTTASVSIANSGTIGGMVSPTFGGIIYSSGTGAGNFTFVNEASGILDADMGTFALRVEKALNIHIENQGSMMGNIELIGDNIEFVSKAGSVNNFNDIAIASNASFQFEITDTGSIGTINSAGTLNLLGSIDLGFDVSLAVLDVGDTLMLFSTSDSIDVSFFYNSTELSDGDLFWVGDYEFNFASSGNEVSVTVNQIIPEPSSYALLSGALLLGFASLRRRRK